MKPQDNAIRLVQEYHLMTGDLKVAIQCAYKAVDEIKKTMYPWQREMLGNWDLVQLEIMAYENSD